MAYIITKINCKEETCYKCHHINGNYCSAFKKWLKEAPYKGGNTSFSRCQECFNWETEVWE